MRSRCISVFFLLAGLATCAFAQGGSCKSNEVPVGIMNIKGESFRGLNATNLTAQVGRTHVGVKAMAFDEGPRRVLLVVDAARKLNDDTRKAERLLVENLLSAARPEDSYALVLARGPERTVKFGEDRKTIVEALPQEALAGKVQNAGVLDAVMQGMEMFGSPQPGDAIIVIAADLEGNKTTSPRKVAKTLHDHHVRMFGLALGPVSARNVSASGQTTTPYGLATGTATGDVVYETGDQDYYPLSHDSGGLVLSAMNGSTQRSYSMKDVKLQQELAYKAHVMANMITSYYRVELDPAMPPKTEDLIVVPSEALRKQFPQMFLLYPHQVGPC